MTPADLSRTVVRAVRDAVEGGELRVRVPERVVVERTRPGGVGEYACNVALRLAREAGQPPREVAVLLAGRLAGAHGVAAVEITGPGFLNFSLAPQAGLLAAVVAQGNRYGHGDALAGQTYSLAATPDTPKTAPADPAGPRGALVRRAVARLLQAQGAQVVGLDPGAEAAPAPTAATPTPLPIAPLARRDVDAVERIGVADAVWLMVATPLKETPKLPDGPLAQDESNPCFLVRYAHSRARAAVRNATRLGYTPDPEAAPDPGPDAPAPDAAPLLAALAEYPLVLEAAAHHRAPERLARHLVTVADALVDFSYDVLPKGDEKPSAAHRSRLALVDAAGTVLAGGLSLLGIDAPDIL